MVQQKLNTAIKKPGVLIQIQLAAYKETTSCYVTTATYITIYSSACFVVLLRNRSIAAVVLYLVVLPSNWWHPYKLLPVSEPMITYSHLALSLSIYCTMSAFNLYICFSSTLLLIIIFSQLCTN